jgi:hypothetical protein
MAIEIQSLSITVTGSQLTSSGHGVVRALFANEAFSLIYGVFRDASTPSQFNWKKIDVTNPGSPAVSTWTVTDTSQPSNQTSNAHGNGFFYDAASGFVYGVYMTTAPKLCVMRINLATGLVEYSSKELLLTGISADWVMPVLGVALTPAADLVVLVGGAAGAVRICKWNLSLLSGTWSTSSTITSNATSTVFNSVKFGTQPTPSSGLTLAADGNLLVFYDSNDSASKYLATDLSFSGSTAFPVSDLGTAFSRNGYIYQTNGAFFDTSSNLVISKWLDRSTAVVSQDKSIVSMTDRIVQVGESISLPVTLKAKDGFGAPMTALSGAVCRFSVVTNRGTIDTDDAALSLSSVGPFRDGNNVPLSRQVDATFDGSGQATAYFQSARTSSLQSIEDVVRITYPAQ